MPLFIIIKELYFILLLIKEIFAEEFIDIKKLSLPDSDSTYFVVLDTGFYLYNLNKENLAIIHEFKNNEFRKSNGAINLTELYDGNQAYLFCLVNEYLFLFNEHTYKVFTYTINEFDSFKGNYYNLMPYKIENDKISFIIAFNKDDTNLFFYFYNFNLNEGINGPKEILFEDMNIKNKMIRCQINSYFTFIICFHYSINNNKKYLITTTFNINEQNLIKDKTSSFESKNTINQIKLAMSNNDKFFVCFLEYKTPICLINDNSFEFKKIECENGNGWSAAYKVLYFPENDHFMLISRSELIATIINNADNSLEKCKKNIFSKQSNIYSIIYNNDYQLINYTTFSNLLEIINKQSEYTKEIKGFTENIINKEELLNNINDFIKNDMNIEYLSDNNEIIIPADEMTISFTSTNTQKEKENTNYTTINLGQCENDLKTAYNISKENNLYILKIDKEQKGKNYPVIEYQVYYPLNGGKMELLNLSFCENSDIELSIPVQINDTIDKYNPKSDYYNDICTKSNSDSNIDIPLNDRKNEFKKNNMSLCEEKCELIGYDNAYKKAKCSCAVKTSISLNNIESDDKNLLDNFLDIKSITNIEIIKCYKIVLNLNNLKNSYGSFIFIFIFILYILCINIFYFKSFKN